MVYWMECLILRLFGKWGLGCGGRGRKYKGSYEGFKVCGGFLGRMRIYEIED